MKTTFINQNTEQTIYEDGLKYLNSRREDFEFFAEFQGIGSEDELRDYIRNGNYTFTEIRDALRKFREAGDLYNYGLSYDYCELGTFNDQKEDYFRFQLSWGGPSDEIRFYEDGTIEYVYLDWFCGVGFDVTGEDWAEFIKSWFESCDMMNFAEKREETDYYIKLYELDNEEDEEETEED